MAPDSLAALRQVFDGGLALEKCRACGCMGGALADLEEGIRRGHLQPLAEDAHTWREFVDPTQYGCIGCNPCHAAMASNALSVLVPPAQASPGGLRLSSHPVDTRWPPAPGDFHVVGRGSARTVAVSTLASPDLALAIAAVRPAGLSIVGKTETENVGIEKVVRNLLATPEVRVLILAGKDSEGHRPGATFLALARSGVDGRMRVSGSPGPKPYLVNLAHAEVERFRAQVRVVDMSGCCDADALVGRVAELARETVPDSAACDCGSRSCATEPRREGALEIGDEAQEVTLDPAGYFVIFPERAARVLCVEHYDYENRLLRTLRGSTAKGLCVALLRGGWVSRMDHAAYIGRQLERAEASLRTGEPFAQDRA